MVEIQFKDNGNIYIIHKGKPMFSGKPKDMNNDELYSLIQFCTQIKKVLLEEKKWRKH